MRDDDTHQSDSEVEETEDEEALFKRAFDNEDIDDLHQHEEL